MPVVDVTATTPKFGVPVTEAAGGRGVPVTKVVPIGSTGKPAGMPVTYVVPPL
jgi:hypothetical protein